MKVLFIQHVSALGGSSRSLLELINNLPEDVDSTVLCPGGKYADLLVKNGIKVHTIVGMPQFNNSMISPYKGWRWLILAREFIFLPFLVFKLFQLRKYKFDIVHINEITQVYGLVLSKILFGKTIMHTRVMMSKKRNWRHEILTKIFKKYADYIIAIDKSVQSTLDDTLNVQVIHNGMSLKNINLRKKKKERFTVGIVANFQRYKGILEFIDATNICVNDRGLDIDFYIYGAEYNSITSLKERIFQSLGFRENLDVIVKEKISKYALGERLQLKGYVHHSDDIYNDIDLLTFPSHLNAVGRPVFEAGFYKVPSIVAIKDPFDDTIQDNVTGICIREKDAIELADAIEMLYSDRKLLEKFGENSFKQVHALFDSKKNSLMIYQIYQNLLT
jgi:glycosyltransferase involved in cell wall biosynthesis